MVKRFPKAIISLIDYSQERWDWRGVAYRLEQVGWNSEMSLVFWSWYMWQAELKTLGVTRYNLRLLEATCSLMGATEWGC